MQVGMKPGIESRGEAGASRLNCKWASLLPGVLGSSDSAEIDSFSDGLLEYPQYTRPANFNGIKVPNVLLSGNHQDIKDWRKRQSFMKTKKNRPDLLK